MVGWSFVLFLSVVDAKLGSNAISVELENVSMIHFGAQSRELPAVPFGHLLLTDISSSLSKQKYVGLQQSLLATRIEDKQKDLEERGLPSVPIIMSKMT